MQLLLTFLGSASVPTWEAWMEHQAPGLGQLQRQPLWPFRSEPDDEPSLCITPSPELCFSNTIFKIDILGPPVPDNH